MKGAFSKKMLPLYYRYTQLEDTPLEVNDGVTYEELSQDRRVSTLFSRPLLNFVPKVKRSKVTGVAVSAVAGATQTATPLRKHTVIETSRKYDSLRCSKEKSFASFLESKNKGFAP